jgi:hypothetical protein
MGGRDCARLSRALEYFIGAAEPKCAKLSKRKRKHPTALEA